MHNSFSIVIVTYNGMSWIRECLESCKPYSIIVVDNASTDGTVDFITTDYPSVTLVPQSKNLGFGQANNLGISLALKRGADYVFLLNQDAYLEQGCIKTLIKAQQENAQYGILSPIHLNGKGNRLDGGFSNYVGFKNNRDFYSDFVLKNTLKEIYEVPFVNAAGWLLSREILEKVGGFDPIFFHYGEDDNYCQRARFHKFKIGVVPITFLRHDREDRKVEVNSIDTFLKLERQLKSRYANINLEDIGTLQSTLRKKKRQLIKLFLQLKFSKMAMLRQEISITEKTIMDVVRSRETNRNLGAHYL